MSRLQLPQLSELVQQISQGSFPTSFSSI